MAQASRSVCRLAKGVRYSTFSRSLARTDNRITARLVAPAVCWRRCNTTADATGSKISEDSTETGSENAVPVESTEHGEPESAETEEAETEKAEESRQEFVQRVQTDTRTKIDYGKLYKKLHHRLSNNKFVKATDMNMICYNTRNTQQMEKVKKLLHLFRCSPSFSRNSLPNVAVEMCLRLKVPEEALEIITDPVKYGIFPGLRTMNKLMLTLAKNGKIESLEKVLQAKKGVDMDVSKYESGYRVMAYTITLVNKHGKKEDPDSQNTLLDASSQECGAEGEDTPTQTADVGGAVPGSQEEEQIREDQKADLPTEGKGDIDGATPTQGSTDPGETAVEGCGTSEDVSKKELDHILLLCYDSFSMQNESFSYYFVHGKLMDKELDSLAKYMLDQLEEDKRLPARLILNLRLDQHRLRSRHAEVMEVLNKMEEAGVVLAWKRLPAIQKFFEDCVNPDLKEAFQQLQLEKKVKPPPPPPPPSSTNHNNSTDKVEL